MGGNAPKNMGKAAPPAPQRSFPLRVHFYRPPATWGVGETDGFLQIFTYRTPSFSEQQQSFSVASGFGFGSKHGEVLGERVID
jgi:hypothetical protein